MVYVLDLTRCVKDTVPKGELLMRPGCEVKRCKVVDGQPRNDCFVVSVVVVDGDYSVLLIL